MAVLIIGQVPVENRALADLQNHLDELTEIRVLEELPHLVSNTRLTSGILKLTKTIKFYSYFSAHNVEQLLRERCERERLSIEQNRVSDAENYPAVNLNTHPDLIKAHAPRYELSNTPTQSTVTLMKDRFEMRNISNHWSEKPSNGDIVNDRSRTHERFEPRLGHMRQLSDENGKEIKTRKNGEKVNGDVKDKEKSRMSPLVLRKKGHSKDKDEQGNISSIIFPSSLITRFYKMFLRWVLSTKNNQVDDI